MTATDIGQTQISCLRITGRLGYVRPTSVNPAARNITMVPVKIADGDAMATQSFDIDWVAIEH
jgi:hypothetical protein